MGDNGRGCSGKKLGAIVARQHTIAKYAKLAKLKDVLKDLLAWEGLGFVPTSCMAAHKKEVAAARTSIREEEQRIQNNPRGHSYSSQDWRGRYSCDDDDDDDDCSLSPLHEEECCNDDDSVPEDQRESIEEGDRWARAAKMYRECEEGQW